MPGFHTVRTFRVLVRSLMSALGRELTLVPGSTVEETDTFSATLQTKPTRDAAAITFDMLVKLNITYQSGGSEQAEALVFVFVCGRRVAVPGACYLVMSLDESGKWTTPEWESDVYNEWGDLESLG